MSLLALVMSANLATRGAAIGLGTWLSVRLAKVLGGDLVSLATGLLLAIAVFNLVPQAIESSGSVTMVALTMALTWVAFMLVQRVTASKQHAQGCACQANHQAGSTLPFLAGLSLHNTLDGMLVATTFMADTTLGWFVALAIMLHEVPQSTATLVVLKQAGMAHVRAVVTLTLVSMMAVLGAGLGFWAFSLSSAVLPVAMSISAMSFLYIIGTHLLPEVWSHFQAQRWRTASMMSSGLALGGLLLIFEP